MDKIRVMLCDNHTIVRNGIKSLLNAFSETTVVAEATDSKTLLYALKAQALEVDLILADIKMPEMEAQSLTEALAKDFPSIKLIILSMLDQEKYVREAFKKGVNGYLLKNISESELRFAIQQVMAGAFYLCSELTFKLMRLLTSNLPGNRWMNQTTELRFTPRELSILHLIAAGCTNAEIAEKLFISKRTVEGHRLQMIQKARVRNTAALVNFGLIQGFLPVMNSET